jgi:hypothetical protein
MEYVEKAKTFAIENWKGLVAGLVLGYLVAKFF